jgi:hypothetical protein
MYADFLHSFIQQIFMDVLSNKEMNVKPAALGCQTAVLMKFNHKRLCPNSTFICWLFFQSIDLDL